MQTKCLMPENSKKVLLTIWTIRSVVPFKLRHCYPLTTTFPQFGSSYHSIALRVKKWILCFELLKNTAMIRNYLKIAFRALWRNKVHSAINVFGLGWGFACCILIVLLFPMWAFDTFHTKADPHLSSIRAREWGVNQEFSTQQRHSQWNPLWRKIFPEVESYVRFVKNGTQIPSGRKSVYGNHYHGRSWFVHSFDFRLLKGERDAVLANQTNIVISDWAAEKYFGEADPINKVISVQLGETFEDFTVSGVVHIPTNSSIQFYLLIQEQNLPQLFNERVLTSTWFNINPETYVLLRDGVQPKQLLINFHRCSRQF